MKKVPVSLIIDDSAPLVSVFYHHASAKKQTRDGRPLQPIFPNSLLLDFCEVMERHGIKGKFSIVPMPGNQGDIVNGLKGVTKEELDEWMDIVKKRVVPNFTVGPEMLTHDNAINLEDGSEYDLHEDDWAATQNRATLTPYITKAVSLVKEAGFKVFGATSPWAFGLPVEDDSLPTIIPESAVLEWSQKISEGERRRQGEGGVPIYNPTMGRVTVACDIFKEMYNRQHRLQQATAEALASVAALRPECDRIIFDVWQEIEEKFATLTGDERIKRCSEYGIIYYTRRDRNKGSQIPASDNE